MLDKCGIFVTYNGALEPLVQSQGLPYLRELSHRGWRLSLVSFERPSRDRARQRREIDTLAAQLAREGIRWSRSWYHKHPALLSTLWDVGVGIVAVWRVVRVEGRQVLHARGTIPALMVWPVAWTCRCPWVFDVRGLVAEEYADAGIWPRGSLRYRIARRVERWLIRRADALVVLTHRIAQQLGTYAGTDRLAPLQVIPCCVDLARFPAPLNGAHRRQGSAAWTMVYLGSLGTWYLFDEMLACFKVFQHRVPRARFLILTHSPSPRDLEARCARLGVDRDLVELKPVSPGDVAQELAQSQCGIALIQPTFSKSASSPTKIGEYLAAGLPVIVNAGVGDLAEFVEGGRIGVVLDQLTPEAYERGAEALLRLLKEGPVLARRCRETAETFLSVTMAGTRYDDIYTALWSQREAP